MADLFLILAVSAAIIFGALYLGVDAWRRSQEDDE